MENTFSIPEGMGTEYKLYKLPQASRRVLIMNDIHLPYHNVDAINVCLKFAKKEKIDTILLNGDIFDFYKLSKYVKDPGEVDLVDELQLGMEFFDALKEGFPKAKIFFKVGNHEERLNTYLKMKAPELFSLPYFNYSEFLQLRSRGIELIDKSRIILSGDLAILHGHEIRLGAGAVNPARSLFLKFKVSSAAGHLHRTSTYTDVDGFGKTITTHSIGCLCELHPEYAPINKWNHGFAINYVNRNGISDFRNFRIVNGKVKI